MRVLVLGHKGMLGTTVCRYLESKGHVVFTTPLKWPNNSFKEYVLESECDAIVNCAGSIPQRSNDFFINYSLPIWLDCSIPQRVPIIHAGTDCESDASDYGISKRLASEYLLRAGTHTKMIKCSIIGEGGNGLMQWQINNRGKKISGYVDSFWNGITTLEWAKICCKHIDPLNNPGPDFSTITPATACISKYDLLGIIDDIYGLETIINKQFNDNNKCLEGDYAVPEIRQQIKELKQFNDNYRDL